MSAAAVQPIVHSGAVYGPVLKVATIPFPGGETFGVFGERPGPTRSGKATLVAVFDRAAEQLQPGELLLAENARGLYPVRVARTRTSVAGELGAQYECLVVDARCLDGRCLTYAPADLLDVEVDS